MNKSQRTKREKIWKYRRTNKYSFVRKRYVWYTEFTCRIKSEWIKHFKYPTKIRAMISKRFSGLYFDFSLKKRQKPERIPISTLFITRPVFILPMCQCRHTSHRTANFSFPTCQSRHTSHLIQYTILRSIRQGKNSKTFCMYYIKSKIS